MHYASVIVDIPTRELASAFYYEVPAELVATAQVGCCVLVDFAHRKALGYIVDIACDLPAGTDASKVKSIDDILSEPFFDAASAELAKWIAHEYMSPLSEAIHLFVPSGAAPKLRKTADGKYHITGLKHRKREPEELPKRTYDIEDLTAGQREALDAIKTAMAARNSDTPARHSDTPLRHSDAPLRHSGLDPESIAASSQSVPTILLDGVTGSGKTEVYLQAIGHALANGGSAIVLVPEISLTPQTVARFKGRFGDKVAVIHSRMTPAERAYQWDLMRTGTASVAVGARSALFAPLNNLRLIIIDEEHEQTYKQGSTPRYVTRDAARMRARLTGSVLVLGSATPSLETLAAVRANRVRRIELPERAGAGRIPSVHVVNLAAEFQGGNKTMYSSVLADALVETIELHEKAVVLLNRRGFSSFLLCRDCGYVPTCDDCSVSLTYHASPPTLRCHQCGATYPVPVKCPQCGSMYLRKLGYGTEQAAMQLASLLPEGTPLIRMDADTTRGRGGHNARLQEFIKADYGVLLGTQMIAKGLDFPDVTLVGVLLADTSLNLPDFRAAERAYQLLEQVSGRAGRGELAGRVIVQTYWPEHPSIRAAAAHDREILYARERDTRNELGYPPYTRLANVLLWGKDEAAVQKHAMRLAGQLREALDGPHVDEGTPWRLMGPSPCVISKRQGDYRWHILIKAPAGADVPSVIEPITRAYKTKDDTRMAVDIDPYDLM